MKHKTQKAMILKTTLISAQMAKKIDVKVIHSNSLNYTQKLTQCAKVHVLKLCKRSESSKTPYTRKFLASTRQSPMSDQGNKSSRAWVSLGSGATFTHYVSIRLRS